MADGNLFSEYLKPVRSVADYSADLDKQEGNALELTAKRISAADDVAARKVYSASGGDSAKALNGLQAAGLYKQAQAMQKSMLDNKESQSKIDLAASHGKNFDQMTAASQAEQQYKAADHHSQGLSYVKTPDDARTYISQGISKGVFQAMSPEEINQRLSQYKTVDEFVQAATKASVPVLEQYKSAALDERGRLDRENRVLTTKMGNDTSIKTNAVTNETTRRGQNLTDDRSRDALEGAKDAFTPEAIKNAASRYNIDGTLPPMGMGKAGSAGRAAILNEAAVQAGASGISGDDQRIAQIGNKANTAALSKLQQSQTMVGAFEKNFTRNADIALEESKKVDGTGVPLVNKWLNAGKRSIAGDAQLAAYDAVIKSTSNEYAKIISGSMGNTAIAEGEIKKIEGLLNSAQTPKQVEAVINMMKRETQNRMKGFDEEKESLRASMSTKKAAPAADSSKAAAGLPGGWSVKAH